MFKPFTFSPLASIRNRFFLGQKRVRKGFVLIFILGMIFFLSIIVTQFLIDANRELFRRGRSVYEGEFRVQAMNAVMLAMAVIKECWYLDRGVYHPFQGWTDPVRYAGYQFEEGWTGTIQVVDESGKIPLSAETKPRTLNLLFEEIGVSPAEAATLTDCILDWMDADDRTRLNGAENDYYERLSPPYAAANAPLKSFKDLLYVKGFRELFFDEDKNPNELYRKFADAVSFRRPMGSVNVNTASDLVLNVMGKMYGFDPEVPRARLQGPDGVRMTADDRSLRNPADLGLAKIPSDRPVDWWASFFRIEVQMRKGDLNYRLTALVEREPKPDPSRNPKLKRRGKSAVSEESFPAMELFWGGLEE
jgi:type II secretory pathway component PulK